MSYYNYSPVQGQMSRSNFGVSPRQSVQNTSYGNRMQSGSMSNNRLHPGQNSVYGRQSQAPNIQAVSSSQYLHSSPSAGFQGRQSQYGRPQVGRASPPVGGGPMTVNLPPRMISSQMGRPQMQQSSAVQQPSQGQSQFPGTTGPDGIKYIPLNWQDLLGGQNGMKGLQVSMAPSGDPGNPNRQLKFSFGAPGQGDAPANPGDVPLKVVSFTPVEDYPGKGGSPITMNSPQMQQQAISPVNPSGYQLQQYQNQMRSSASQSQPQKPMRANPMIPSAVSNSLPAQSQMIMMPPVYYSPSKGIISAPGGQGMNSCQGCSNCKGNVNPAAPRNNQRF